MDGVPDGAVRPPEPDLGRGNHPTYRDRIRTGDLFQSAQGPLSDILGRFLPYLLHLCFHCDTGADDGACNSPHTWQGARAQDSYGLPVARADRILPHPGDPGAAVSCMSTRALF